MEYVIKRNNIEVEFDPNKIISAVLRAMDSTEDNEEDHATAVKVKNRVLRLVRGWNVEKPHVDLIHTAVERSLMDAKLYETARAYITYRDANKPDIFRKRQEIKPYEYPQLIGFLDAIRDTYWTHNEFNFESDIQDIKINLDEKQKMAAIRAMLAISQIESAVKTFWGKIGDRLKKPEVAKVGATFAESEVRHEDAYSQLLEKLNLNGEFKELKDVPAIQKRITYLNKVNKNMRSTEDKDFFESVILFSMFVENVSLFSQFLILMSFNYHDNRLKGISNAVQATSKEETIHAMFGFEIVNIIKEENPDWFDEDLIEYVKEMSYEAFNAEKEIVDWIYEYGDLLIIPKEVTLNYIKKRMNDSLNSIGIDSIFGVDVDLLEKTQWFDEEITLPSTVDFFYKRNTAYSKRTKAITADDLF